MNKPIDYRRNKKKERFAPSFELFMKNIKKFKKDEASIKTITNLFKKDD